MHSLSLGKERITYDRENITQSLKEFNDIYLSRPIVDNSGGMTSVHLFNTWHALKQLNPKLVIESGVWKGLGTWIIEKALPDCSIVSLDISFANLKFKSDNSTYLGQDIKSIDWNKFLSEQYPDVKRSDIVLFLDDHQDILDRVEFIHNLGIKHILYEDNYPTLQGDVLSPKKILTCQDYIIEKNGIREMKRFSYMDYAKFLEYVDVYQELPPIFKPEETRWGDAWNNKDYPTEQELLSIDQKSKFEIFFNESKDYTWICYMELN